MSKPSPVRVALAAALLAILAAPGCASSDTSTFVLPATTTATTSSTGATPPDLTPTVEDAATSQAGAAPAPSPTRTTGTGTATASPSPTLASGPAAKKIVIAALASLDRHGPYRTTVTMTAKGKGTLTLLVDERVPPSREHVYLGPVKDAAVESVTIGSQTWTRQGTGPWEKTATEPDEGKPDLPDSGDVVGVTEKPSRDRTLRVFAVRLADTPSTARCTVTVDRSGRLRSLTATTAEGSMSFRYTYDRTIAVKPPA